MSDPTKEILDEIQVLKFNSDVRELINNLREYERRKKVLEVLSTKLEIAKALGKVIKYD